MRLGRGFRIRLPPDLAIFQSHDEGALIVEPHRGEGGHGDGPGAAALNPKDGVSKSFDTDLVQWTNATKLLTLSHQSIFRTGGQVLKVASITVDFNKDEVHLGKVDGVIEAPGP